ncbi:zinc finger protein 692 [Apteryx mantelli]|uniref:Zinc finger protein 692 n=1 Tax=Apteryx mantelli TaxID=2696672 RepID=A0ABM4FYG2_9AVES
MSFLPPCPHRHPPLRPIHVPILPRAPSMSFLVPCPPPPSCPILVPRPPSCPIPILPCAPSIPVSLPLSAGAAAAGPMEPGRPGRPRAPDCVRKQKRRELDARRSKCRIRLGGHLEQWCRLKEQLGFSLHSQLAKYLLDRYSSQGCLLSPAGDPEPDLLHAGALQRLVVLSHDHSQECSFVPDVKAPSQGCRDNLVWECVAGHSFSWGLSGERLRGEERRPNSGSGSPPPLAAGRRRSLRRAGLAADPRETEPGPRKDGGEPERTETLSPAGDVDQGEEPGAGSDDAVAAPRAQTETGMGTAAADRESPPVSQEKPEQGPEPQEEEDEEEDEDFAEEDDLAYADDLRDENYHPSLDGDSEPQRRQNQSKTRKKAVKEERTLAETSPADASPSPSPAEDKGGRVSCKKRAGTCDEDVAQIGPKRIRKAAKREILLCDFEGCGKIFSNRQYLNHHKKYQHVHQKTFTCSEPSCGKSFNFKKHLKEHEKLHSDKRDYICEFCARSFRTSSNLIIHRRIHTGEKPLQCEICGFTCRQKASLNWHMKKHDADAFYQFPCDLCGKKFEKKDNVAAHKSKSHPEAPGAPGQPEPPGPALAPAEGAGASSPTREGAAIKNYFA